MRIFTIISIAILIAGCGTTTQLQRSGIIGFDIKPDDSIALQVMKHAEWAFELRDAEVEGDGNYGYQGGEIENLIDLGTSASALTGNGPMSGPGWGAAFLLNSFVDHGPARSENFAWISKDIAPDEDSAEMHLEGRLLQVIPEIMTEYQVTSGTDKYGDSGYYIVGGPCSLDDKCYVKGDARVDKEQVAPNVLGGYPAWRVRFNLSFSNSAYDRGLPKEFYLSDGRLKLSDVMIDPGVTFYFAPDAKNQRPAFLVMSGKYYQFVRKPR